jgi:hypothetical protein
MIYLSHSGNGGKPTPPITEWFVVQSPFHPLRDEVNRLLAAGRKVLAINPAGGQPVEIVDPLV